MSTFALQGLATGAALFIASFGIIFGITMGRPRTPRARLGVLVGGLLFALVAVVAIWAVPPLVTATR